MKTIHITISTLIALLLTLTLSCEGGKMSVKNVSYDKLKEIPIATWQKLAEKKIYFGHQSVGYNIMDGVTDVMKENPEIKLNIVETVDSSDFKVGLFAHSRVGKNVDPKSKIDDFVNFIDEGIGKKADVSALKFCYVDIMPITDVEKLFDEYTMSTEKLRTKYPGMIILHFTNPLTTIQTGIKAWIKKIIGRPLSGVADNIKRNQYNQ